MAIKSNKQFEIYAPVVVEKVRTQIHTLDILYKNNEIYISDNLEKEAQKMIDDYNGKFPIKTTDDEEEAWEFSQYVNDFFGKSLETKNVLSQYMIVASYSFYEKGIKKILSLTQKFTDKELQNCYREKELKKTLKNKFSIDYTTLQKHQDIEELRCLNNSIKHNETVNEELSNKNVKWEKGQLIENIYEDFNRLKDTPIDFLSDLISKISK